MGAIKIGLDQRKRKQSESGVMSHIRNFWRSSTDINWLFINQFQIDRNYISENIRRQCSDRFEWRTSLCCPCPISKQVDFLCRVFSQLRQATWSTLSSLSWVSGLDRSIITLVGDQCVRLLFFPSSDKICRQKTCSADLGGEVAFQSRRTHSHVSGRGR